MLAGFLLLSALLLSKLDLSSCQVCNAMGFYCVTNTTFQQCVDNGPPSGPVNVCNVGTFCSMDCPLQCREVIPCTTTTTTSTTTTSTTTTPAPFVCTASGRFADPRNCTNYYMCSPKASGGFYQYLYACPGGSVFSTAFSKCTVDSTGTICPSSTSSTSTASTPLSSPFIPLLSTSATTTVAPAFRCTNEGMFPHSEDCTKYYLCSSDGNGGFHQASYACPSGSVFNRTTGKCTTSSVCL